jgi:predicted SAM-dependent methyltransferase
MNRPRTLALWAWKLAPPARALIPPLWRPWGSRALQHAAAERRARGEPIRLHLGAAGHRLPGWLDTDLSPEAPYHLDTQRPFPLPDGSVAAIFAENLIEHMPLHALPGLLDECHRVLAPGAVLRLATPDLEAYARAYVERTPSGWALLERNRRYGYEFGPGIAAIVNKIVYADGHRYCFDFETLSTFLEKAGFTHVRRARVAESEHADLRGLEQHDVDTVLDDFVLAVDARRADR